VVHQQELSTLHLLDKVAPDPVALDSEDLEEAALPKNSVSTAPLLITNLQDLLAAAVWAMYPLLLVDEPPLHKDTVPNASLLQMLPLIEKVNPLLLVMVATSIIKWNTILSNK